MPWTAPITWVDGVIYDESDLNAQIRDNEEVVKFSRNDAGKIIALTSTYFNSLDASTITGINDFGTVNTWSLKNDFNPGNGRLVVGYSNNGISYPGVFGRANVLEILVGLSSNGIRFHWANGELLITTSKTSTGDVVIGAAPPGSIKGSIWVEGTQLHFISDFSYQERAFNGSLVGAASPGLPGSIWIEVTNPGGPGEDAFLHYIDELDAERIAF